MNTHKKERGQYPAPLIEERIWSEEWSWEKNTIFFLDTNERVLIPSGRDSAILPLG